MLSRSDTIVVHRWKDAQTDSIAISTSSISVVNNCEHVIKNLAIKKFVVNYMTL